MTTDNSNVLIKVDNLCKSFDDVEVLKGINAEIDKGDVMVVIGASGALSEPARRADLGFHLF